MNLIRDAKITNTDIDMIEKTFGPDIDPSQAVSNRIGIPPELLSIHKEVILSIDGMSVNLLECLTTITHNIMYRTGLYLAEVNTENYEKCMSEIYYVYRKGGFIIAEIHFNNEFHTAMDSFAAKQKLV